MSISPFDWPQIQCSNRMELEPDPKLDRILAIAVVVAVDDRITHRIVMMLSEPTEHQKC